MSQPSARQDRGREFLIAAWLLVALVLGGFSKTYFLPLWRGTFAGTAVFHIHGALLFGWVGLFWVQTMLARRGQVSIHRRLGVTAIALVPAVIVSTIAVGVTAIRRDLAAGLGPVAISSFVGIVTSMLWFGALVGAALLTRRQPATHKRLMLVATLAVIWPAAFRFRHYFPSIPRPDIVFGVMLPAMILVGAAGYDLFARQRVHGVYWIVGGAWVLEQTAEALAFDGPIWRVVANWLTAPFL